MQLLITHEAMEAAKMSMVNKTGEIADMMEKLTHDLEPHLSDWTGDSSSALATAKTQWLKTVGELNELLNALGLSVGQVSDDFANLDKYHAGQISAN